MLLAALVLAATGCAGGARRVVPTPTVEAPASYAAAPADVETSTAGVETSTADWLVSFADPELDRMVLAALEHNGDLAAAAARVEQAAALARIAGADLAPQASVSLAGRRNRSNFFGLPLPGSRSGVFAVTSTSYGASLDLSWEADLWGRLRAGARAALADRAAAEASLAGARLSLAGQTAKALFAAREARLQARLAQRTLESYRSSLRSTERRFDAGLVGALDLRLARSAVDSAEAAASARVQAAGQTLRQLEVLVGRYPEAQLAIEAALPAPPAAVPAGLPAELVSRRPDLIAAEWRLQAAGARLSEARAARYPRLALTASGGTSSPHLRHLVDSRFKVWSIAGNLLQPLLQGGRLKAGVRLNEARLREAAEGFGQELLRAYAEVESLLDAETRLASQERSLAAASEQARAARALAEDRYREGLIDIFGLLEARRSALAAESQWLSLRRQRLSNRVDLHLALGGGFELPARGTDGTTAGDRGLDSESAMGGAGSPTDRTDGSTAGDRAPDSESAMGGAGSPTDRTAGTSTGDRGGDIQPAGGGARGPAGRSAGTSRVDRGVETDERTGGSGGLTKKAGRRIVEGGDVEIGTSPGVGSADPGGQGREPIGGVSGDE